MAYIYDLTDTWNAGGTTFSAIKMNVTDSASAAGSKLVTLQTNGTEHFSVTKAGVGYFSGNVGIGTTAPTYRLHVSTSGVNALGVYRDFDVTSVGAAGQIIEIGARNGTTFTPGASITGVLNNPATTGYLSFETRAAGVMGERMRITSAGDVGIGTSSPSAKLDVVTAGAFAAEFNGTNTYVDIIDSTVTGRLQALGNVFYVGTTAASKNLGFKSGAGVEAMLITSAGNVGIGTSSPGSRLTINDPGTGAQFANAASGNFNIGLLAGTGSALAYVYQRANSDLLFGTNNSERMRIDASGNVGIGTSSPDAKLRVSAASPARGIIQVVSATGSTGSQINFGQSGVADWAIGQPAGANAFSIWNNRSVSTDGTELVRITSSGNLLLGTTASSGTPYILELNTASDTRIGIKAGNVLTGIIQATTNNFSIATSGASTVTTFSTNGAERMRIKSSGGVRYIPLASAPSSPEAGEVYYDSTTNKLRCYNGTTWNDLF